MTNEGNPAQALAERIVAGGEATPEEMRRLVEMAEKDDIVVILGKGHENYQILKDKTIHFDDKEEARAAVAAKLAEKN